MGTIINLAQNFVGSNNVNLLQPVGQFGTRLHGGKDAASPRYIFTMLSPLTTLLYHPLDNPCLKWLFDDNQRIEPEWYCPILPVVLMNGIEGIGTGYSTKIPNHDVREIAQNIKRMIEGEEPERMVSSPLWFVTVRYKAQNHSYKIILCIWHGQELYYKYFLSIDTKFQELQRRNNPDRTQQICHKGYH